ncbi:GNAT family N-acetyltransferase [Actinomadura roseirufa]|uniref:GNAT family N-acetyltransferase n=1 Tax=Actinomadura roseirufa TaxID=2094049 RepID=UPI001A954A31|nr:GNAT family N-acetyltransferase [Actinomadura roseirufa]
MNVTVTVTAADSEHIDAIVTLLEEMDRFYGATEFEPLGVRRRQVEQALFSDPPAAYALLAWDAGQLVGIASYSFLWPAVGLTRSLYLKELYVAESRWRSGIGTELMRALLDVATEHECSRVEWTTDRENDSAQQFYRDLGLAQHPKLFYRADHTAITSALA